MRIGMVVADPAAGGGTERSALLAAAELRERGHEVHLLHGVATPCGVAADGEIGEPTLFDYHGVSPFPSGGPAGRRLRQYLDDTGIDVVHVHSFPRAGLRGVLGERPHVITVHVVPCPNASRYQWATGHACDRRIGLGCLTTGYSKLGCGHLGNGAPMSPQGFALGMVRDNRFRRQLGRADGLVAPSEWMAAHLAELGLPPETTSVVEPPITRSASTGSTTSTSTRTAERAPASGLPVVAFIGRLVQIKGADVLLRASAATGVPHELVLAGDGGARADLELLAAELGIADRTRFVGHLSPERADDLRRRSAVVAVPSRVPETFGMVGPEALLAGTPVVAHDYAGMSGWIAVGGPMVRGVGLGDVAAFSGALTDLLLHPPTEAVRAQVVADVADRFSLARHATGLEGVYARALARTGRTPAVAVPRH